MEGMGSGYSSVAARLGWEGAGGGAGTRGQHEELSQCSRVDQSPHTSQRGGLSPLPIAAGHPKPPCIATGQPQIAGPRGGQPHSAGTLR